MERRELRPGGIRVQLAEPVLRTQGQLMCFRPRHQLHPPTEIVEGDGVRFEAHQVGGSSERSAGFVRVLAAVGSYVENREGVRFRYSGSHATEDAPLTAQLYIERRASDPQPVQSDSVERAPR